MQIKEKMLSGFVWSGSGKMLSMGSNFLITIILAKALSPSDYGFYFISLTTIVIFATFGTMGMDQVVVRFVAICLAKKSWAAIQNVVCVCLIAACISAALICCIFLFSGPIFFNKVINAHPLSSYMGLLGAWIFFATIQRQLAETFRGLNDIRLATLFGGVRNSGIVNSILSCILMSVLWVNDDLNLFSALLAMLIASIAVVGFSGYIMTRKVTKNKKGYTSAEPNTSINFTYGLALREAWPLWLAACIATLNSLGTPWLASAVDTSNHVALFGVAQRFTLILVAPMTIINAVLPPLISQLHDLKDLGRLEVLVRSSSGVLLVPAVLILSFLGVVGGPLLVLLFGAFYQKAYIIMMMLCLAQAVNIGTGAWQVVLPMIGARFERLTTSIISVITQLGLGIFLGSYFGVYGVAVGYCVSVVVINIVGMIFVRRILGMWTYARLRRSDIYQIKMLLSERMKGLNKSGVRCQS